MDTGALASFVDLACANRDLLVWAIAALAVHAGCSVVTATTHTPDPSTALGKLYRGIELVAGVTRKAKEIGLKPLP